MYQVVVKAEVADDENPRHAIIRKVRVVVINVNEAPVFFETTDTLEISENPDDPEKEATPERGELYLLNRGLGKPAANLPVRSTGPGPRDSGCRQGRRQHLDVATNYTAGDTPTTNTRDNPSDPAD